jgi:hypothetical protein
MREAIMMMREEVMISISDQKRRSVQIRRNQAPSSAIKRHQAPSDACSPTQSSAIKRHQRVSQMQSSAIKRHQRVLTGGMSVACAASHSTTSRVPNAG